MTVVPRGYRGGDTLRRAVDVLLAGIAAVLLGPLLTAAALLVRIRLGKPVLFRQQRSGLGGQEFCIYKLRTMREESYPGEPDPDRLIPLGSKLRHLSIDELPQLWNVVRGDMAIVGPRPTLPEQVRHYSARQMGRLTVRPGITGWAQVVTRNRASWPERIQLDLWYVEHRGWALDARILALTVVHLVRPRGVTADGGVNPGFPCPGADEVCAASASPR